ncbi:MAG: YceI family protein [Streptosporangiaceae bacterium]
MASTQTNHEARDNDLRSSNFLEVDKYPTMTFQSTGVAPADPDKYTLTGNLTIKGHTQPVWPAAPSAMTSTPTR